MIVGFKYSQDDSTWGSYRSVKNNGSVSRLHTRLQWLLRPRNLRNYLAGSEDIYHPSIKSKILTEIQNRDIIHCHNLHGRYFPLGFLPRLSATRPLILTLHDAWLMSGHCVHSIDCDRWKIGCGKCPDLSLPISIPRDVTRANWLRKKEIFEESRLRLAAPCKWLLDKARESILSPAIVESRVVPYGVDLDTFRPNQGRAELRQNNQERFTLLFVANGIVKNQFKDFKTLEQMAVQLSSLEKEIKITIICLGDSGPTKRFSNVEIRFEPFQSDPREVARHFQAADLYLHPALVDTFPNSILEALACGTPVVASSVGGTPEQVKSLWDHPSGMAVNRAHATGILVAKQDAKKFAEAVSLLLGNDTLRMQLAANAREDAVRRFDFRRQVDDYLAWYEEILASDNEKWRTREGKSRRMELSGS